jgi:hypothetical protein
MPQQAFLATHNEHGKRNEQRIVSLVTFCFTQFYIEAPLQVVAASAVLAPDHLTVLMTCQTALGC